MKAINAKIFVTTVICLAVGYIFMSKTNAQATSGLTGNCAGVFNLTNSLEGSLAVGERDDVNAMVHFNFDTKKASVSQTRLNKVQSEAEVDNEYSTRDRTNQNISIQTDNVIPNAYLVTIQFDGNSPEDYPVMRVLSLGSTGTYLIQGTTFGATGICQKV